MANKLKKEHIRPTTLILVIVILGILVYGAVNMFDVFSLTGSAINLSEAKEIIKLDIKDNDYIGLNDKQIIKVNRDGIKAYDLDGYEVWSDTLSVNNYVVKQREPYIAVGSKEEGKKISLFNTKGKVIDITLDNPVIYFSVNEKGGISVIQKLNSGNMVAAYDVNGKYLGGMISYTSNEGYPTSVELSADNKLLLVTYVKTDEPILTSSIRAIAMEEVEGKEGEGVKYGILERGNLIYEVEFIRDNIWVSIGDQKMTWYDMNGNEIKSIANINSIFRPYLYKQSKYGNGFFPIVSSDYPESSIIKRKDKLTFWNAQGTKDFETELQMAANYLYTDERGVVIGSNNQFIGYNKMGSQTFAYKSTVDVNKVFYLSEMRKGIAVSKENVILLTPKRMVK
ncbi:DUF5711 family protein [Cellulosilyticum ruminicola]|uniref:DUF5711 family protein n=1 Tax=Cellulosilyticum ruminicola TaxID=425254 RepID=UPI0006CFFE57|nr:DUF5711 family protein [Cellulosilyticum ruminicola]